MRPDETRILAALARNLAEAHSALLKLTAYNSLNEADFNRTGMSFFAIAAQALYNDMIAGAIRIFDDHKEAGSLWYILRCCDKAALNAATACAVDIDALRKIAPRLRHIRDKTHFHIDRRTVTAPDLVWADAGVTSHELADALHDVAILLAAIRQEIHGGEMEKPPPYDGSDVKRIIEACREAGERGRS